MALLWVDGFEKYGTANAAADPADVISWKYSTTSPQNVDIYPGRFSGNCIRLDTTTTYVITPDLNPGSDTLIAGFSFKLNSLANADPLVDFRMPQGFGESNTLELTFKVGGTSNGAPIYVSRGNITLNSSANGSFNGINSDTWYYFEAKVKCDTSSGTINCYIDGVEVLSYSGNTQHRALIGIYSRIMFTRPYNVPLHLDDLYIADNTGNGVNDVLGDWRVETLSPTSDASGNWTPSTGNDMYAVIDEDIQDSNYISSNTDGNQAVFNTTNLSANGATGNIEGVMLTCDSLITGNCTKYPKAVTQNGSGGTIQDSGNYMPGVGNATAHTVVMENDPDGNSWSANTVNDFRLGVEVA